MKNEKGNTLIEFIILGVLLIISIIICVYMVSKLMSDENVPKPNFLKKDVVENIIEEDIENTLENTIVNEIEENEIESNEVNENKIEKEDNEYRDNFVYENFWDSYGENGEETTIESAIIQGSENSENQALQLDTTNEAVKELYKLIRGASPSETGSFHLSEKVTIEDFSFERIRKEVFANITIDEVIKSYSENNYTYHDISAEVFEAKARKLFGPDVQINHESFVGTLDQNVVYEDGIYKNVHNIANDFIFELTMDSYLSEAELDGDTVYLYDKYVYREKNCDENGWPTGTENIYSTDDKVNLIRDNVEIDYSVLWGGNAIWGDDKEQITLDAMNDTYLNGQMLTFKHTFKKADDGSYYWYSSEPIYE